VLKGFCGLAVKTPAVCEYSARVNIHSLAGSTPSREILTALLTLELIGKRKSPSLKND
jgi:hypothetical protein